MDESCMDDDQMPTSISVMPSPPSSTSTPSLTNLEIFPFGMVFDEVLLTSPSESTLTSWFTSSSTWKTELCLQPDRLPCNIRNLKRHILTIQQWLADWIKNGSNPFIHPQLYKYRFPQCIRDAYADLACYINKTEANENTVLQIIEERSELLLTSDCNRISSDPHAKLARVHALLIYQVIGLYDGDIRLRHLAQCRIQLLHQWMHEMLDDARQASCLGSFICDTDTVTTSGKPDLDDLFWYSWILAESIRRTWVVASGVQGIFLMMQYGKVAGCEGGMMFTTRKGVWEAQSALEWGRICAEVNVGLIQTAELDKLIEEAAPEDLNDFTKAIVYCTIGIDLQELCNG